ncbi:GntR family transcriptional regulator [Streptosporangium sp. NPDC002721]|uniref:GntR family transcriptional regulator n=1 Tax=Streptosporangium sp. NPDC002721 TaxID=3366188 RepID=UPI0036A49D84
MPEAHTGTAARIADALRHGVTTMQIRPGEKLPPIRTLAERYGVSRNTVAKAIDRLRAEGVIITRYGSGIYARPLDNPTLEQAETPVEETFVAIGRRLDTIARDVADLKAGQAEILDLLARVVAHLEGSDPPPAGTVTS